jgi:hypothetical protein
VIRHIFSVDLGETKDPTAIGLLEMMPIVQGPQRDFTGKFDYVLTHAEQRLGSDPLDWRALSPKTGRPLEFYPAIVERVSALHRRPPLFGQPSALVVDGTAVGIPIVEMFREEMDDLISSGDVLFYPIKITPGDKGPHPGRDGFVHVAKAFIATTIRSVMEQHRWHYLKHLVLGPLVKKQLGDFRVKYTDKQNQTFSAREGTHDDLVLMNGQGLVVGERYFANRQSGGQERLRSTRGR